MNKQATVKFLEQVKVKLINQRLGFRTGICAVMSVVASKNRSNFKAYQDVNMKFKDLFSTGYLWYWGVPNHEDESGLHPAYGLKVEEKLMARLMALDLMIAMVLDGDI